MKGVSTIDTNMKTIKVNVDWEHVGVKSIARVGEHTVVEMGKGAQSQSEDKGASPMETFLSSLGGCIIVFLAGFAQKRRLTVNNIRVNIEGDYDPRGMSSSSSGIRPGFQQIRYQVVVESPDSPEAVRKVIDYAIKACPIKDTMMKGTAVVEANLSKEPKLATIS